MKLIQFKIQINIALKNLNFKNLIECFELMIQNAYRETLGTAKNLFFTFLELKKVN